MNGPDITPAVPVPPDLNVEAAVRAAIAMTLQWRNAFDAGVDLALPDPAADPVALAYGYAETAFASHVFGATLLEQANQLEVYAALKFGPGDEAPAGAPA